MDTSRRPTGFKLEAFPLKPAGPPLWAMEANMLKEILKGLAIPFFGALGCVCFEWLYPQGIVSLSHLMSFLGFGMPFAAGCIATCGAIDHYL